MGLTPKKGGKVDCVTFLQHKKCSNSAIFFLIDVNWKNLIFLCPEKKLQLRGIRPLNILEASLAACSKRHSSVTQNHNQQCSCDRPKNRAIPKEISDEA